MSLVTVIVRSMGRPLLAQALESIARQDYPAIDTVVVDATGGAHPPLPAIGWRAGHTVRLVGSGAQLPRPRAGNLGLDHVRGNCFCWLDDDDAYRPHHVSTLQDAFLRHPDALAVYGRTCVVAQGGPTGTELGHPFNRALMHYGPLFHPSAALFRRRVLELGCRFDERFELCQDRDFVAQVASHGELAFVASTTLDYASDAGTSGTGTGGNRNAGRLVEYESLLRAKWAGPRAEHTERAAAFCRRAVARYGAGQPAEARTWFERCLAAYPGDPNALHGLARLALDEHDYPGAAALARQALAFIADSHEFHLTLALALAQLGRADEAAAAARFAAGNPSLAPAARALLAQSAVSVREAGTGAATPARLARCPCGSGNRYKDCCGSIDQSIAAMPPPSAAARPSAPYSAAVAVAIEAFRQGEALQARSALEPIEPELVEDATAAQQAGAVFLELGDYRRATDFLRRSLQLDPVAQTRRELESACSWLFRDIAHASLSATLQHLAQRIDRRGPAVDAGAAPRKAPGERMTLHLVATLANIGGAEQRVLGLHALLAPHADVRLWSANGPPRAEYARTSPIEVVDARAGALPAGGTVVFSGQHFDWGGWLAGTAPERIVICDNLDQPDELVRRLVPLVDAGLRARIDFTFPSQLMRTFTGLTGEVEIAIVDTHRFCPAAPRRAALSRLVIGRHSREHRLKHHPNDPSFFRRVVALGHRVRVMGGKPLADALARGAPVAGIELLAEGAEAPSIFLQGLDCFVYRKHPQWFETGGTVIYEAMATELPVVAFAGACGALEVIESGRNGFIVATEDEALAVIARLAADPRLRRAVGSAARETIVAVMARQRAAALRFYLAAVDD